ncbi:hypothetical protein A3A71_01120 [Candidatus Berkelbacteria bacterium RIFCSPLOWO2_01_FULL_50_28]|uniref:Uncharacterized protein n=1 Tax=Candidatus Berkelbacteria bacterium RIFCSPLOWO2_01_FULL_50_28 TaxID=1797471 RepID=A0A1F5EB53_9BACT|nr:MAG: hypothetical protein A2807_01690 [Candidatus Berkelbacteria bacterium RIFCSPHIGHO2_01_FULL_50_36]OGD63491.1 MAG: hypothetical protein A3F39_03345 [Candidatus Berkelbacteria bacterium RIFCSPHIGHO2_12_FULL_50_11]OGD64639.1 MAG: hypothetical protein A3A71_01120 [Candidatus Berkelbacteria bacterium RIFCSPLOWO2_01_FULL_50_28]
MDRVTRSIVSWALIGAVVGLVYGYYTEKPYDRPGSNSPSYWASDEGRAVQSQLTKKIGGQGLSGLAIGALVGALAAAVAGNKKE